MQTHTLFLESAVLTAQLKLGTKMTTEANLYVFLFNSKAGMFLGFSISSTVLGIIIIICYSISTAYHNERHPTSVTIMILILGIIEFTIGIWAAVCLFCTCCSTPSQQVSHPRVMHEVLNREVTFAANG